MTASEPDAKTASRAKALLWTAVKWAVVIAVTFFVGREIYRRCQAVSWDQIHFAPTFWVFAGLSMCASITMMVTAYWLLLARLRRPLPWSRTFAVACVSLAGKYLPGKAPTLVGAVWLFNKEGVPVRSAVGAVLLRTGLTVAVGLVISVPLTLTASFREAFPWAWVACLVFSGLGVLCMHPMVFGAIARPLLRKLRRQELGDLPRLRDYLAPAGAVLVQWFFVGLALWFVVSSITSVSLDLLPAFISVGAMAVTYGFVIFLAPAGLGVREAIFVAALGPIIGGDLAAVVAVAMRLVHTLAEALMALVGLVLLRTGRLSAETPATTMPPQAPPRPDRVE